MKTLYLDCIAGISGDMTLAACIDLGVDAEWLRTELQKLPIDGWSLEVRRVDKNGFAATKVDVRVGPQPHARPLPAIEEVIHSSALSDKVKSGALRVVRMIAEAEAQIHGMPVEQVHLHEVSGEDAILDICGALLCMEALNIERVECSPLPMGRGFIKGAHGQIPLPAPATVAILKGVPIRGIGVDAELVTPTGAALARHLTKRFGGLPAMKLEGVGYGAGTWDLAIPNLLRLFLGDAEGTGLEMDTVAVLETNIDDQNPELQAHVMQRLLEAGALDVTMTPTHMKKDRSGVVLSVIARPEDKAAMRSLILTETSSLGVREQELQRSLLHRDRIEVETPWGKTFVKVGHLPNGQHKYAPEFEDCRRLARTANVPLREVYVAAETAARYAHELTHHHSK